jgi:two-component system nitrogen regulation response regulator NtrX
MPYEILVVDDEKDICELVSGILADDGYDTRIAESGQSALLAINEHRPDLVLLDVWLGDGARDGLGILESIQKDYPYVPVVMMSGHGTVETAVSAIKMGAYDFIEKPFQIDRLLLVLKRALESYKLKRENDALKIQSPFLCSLMGSSSPILEVKQLVHTLAPTDSRICLHGPIGCDRVAIARFIHNLSLRADQPFLSLNCASFPLTQIEAEIFGLEFPRMESAVVPKKIGLLEHAHKGTLFIDEMSLLPPAAQTRLACFLHKGEFVRLGGTQKNQLNVRILVGTSQTEEELLQHPSFSKDLYYRTHVSTLILPPLAERARDIGLLAKSFLTALAASQNTAPKQLTESALAILESYPWPGDIQQFKNALEWMLITSLSTQSDCLDVDGLPPEIIQGNEFMKLRTNKSASIASLPIKEAREIFEKEYLLSQLRRFNGQVAQTAKFIGMDRASLYRKLKNLGILAEKDRFEENL